MSGHLTHLPGSKLAQGSEDSETTKVFGAAPAAEGIRHGRKGKQITVLIVDDEEAISRSIVRCFKGDGYTFKLASDGVEGLGIFMQGGVDFVLTDLRMPKMGGFALLQKIMAEDPGAKVVVASGNFSHAEREEMRANGALATLDKPYDMETLRSLIHGATEEPEAQQPHAAEAQPASRRFARVLVVDDDPDSRDALCMLLEGEGHTVKAAENGLDGLAAFYAGGVDIVLSDFHMPKMNGHEMLLEIRKANPIAKVIMMSGEARASERAALLMDGAAAVLQKPIDMDQLQQLISQAISE